MRFTPGAVLGLAALVSSQALWKALVTHQMPLDVALTRFLVCALIVWAGLTVVTFLIGPPGSTAAAVETATRDAPTSGPGQSDVGGPAPSS